MNEHEFERAFRAWSRAQAAEPASSTLRDRVLDVPLTTRLGRGRWAWIEVGRFGSVFSATRFVVAGAIVALFGGFLLAGLLTQPSDDMAPAAVTASPSPTMTEDLLSGMVTEEVEPGVYRVDGDGIRDLSVVGLPRQRDLTITPDGSVWIYSSSPAAAYTDRTLWEAPTRIRLGDPTAYDPESYRAAVGDIPDGVRLGAPWDIDTSGTVWAGGVYASVLERGESGSTKHPIDLEDLGLDPVSTPAEQAAVEALRAERAAAGLDPDVTIVTDSSQPVVTGLVVDADGDVWVALADPGRRSGSMIPTVLLRFDGQTWSAVDPVGVGAYANVVLTHVGPNGSLWVYLETGADDPPEPHLARLADGRWTLFGREDGVVPLASRDYGPNLLRVGPDGALWAKPRAQGSSGVRAFDGTTWRQYLEGHVATDLEIGPDGDVWVLTSDQRSFQDPDAQLDLYVITPEAVVVTE